MATSLRHLLSTRDLDVEMVEHLFSRACALKRLRGVLSAHEKNLSGETVVNLFWEPSARTRVAYELAAHRLGAHVVNLDPRDSCATRGESPEDAVASLRALGCRFFILRHGVSGEIARLAGVAVRDVHLVNAGDGINERPCQALSDALTIREKKKDFQGLEIAILGDVLRSRTAHSHLNLLPRLGAKIRCAGPKELLPPRLEPEGTAVVSSVEEAIRGADVVMALRLQRDRGGTDFTMPDEEYRRRFGLTAQRLALAKPDAIVLHPGPVVRGVEIDPDVAAGPQSMILRQVENGLFMRMAILEALHGDLE